MHVSPLFIIDNMTVSRQKSVTLFERSFTDIQCFNSAESFLYNAEIAQIGCVLLDNRLPGIDGISLQTTLNQRQSPLSLVFHSDSMSVSAAVSALKAGAVDILIKPAEDSALLETVNHALANSQQKAQDLDNAARLRSLTKREKSVLDEVLKGATNQQIAENLAISLRTVEVHRANMMKKFNTHSAIELAMTLAKIMN